jgi:hypothetical protein
MELLFETLRRGKVQRPRSDRSHLGLGLFIVRQIARAHGREVHGHSESRRVRFTVTLPKVAPVSAVRAGPEQAVVTARPRYKGMALCTLCHTLLRTVGRRLSSGRRRSTNSMPPLLAPCLECLPKMAVSHGSGALGLHVFLGRGCRRHALEVGYEPHVQIGLRFASEALQLSP